ATLGVSQNRVMNSVRLANRRVWEACQTRRDCEGMGTTFSIFVCTHDTPTIWNVCDSRVYIFCDLRLRVPSRARALVASLVDARKISPEEARVHPLRHVLTMALGHAEDIAVQLVEFVLKPGDHLLVCTDGLHSVVEEPTFTRIIAQQKEPRALAEELV